MKFKNEIFSVKVDASSRTYFFDVKESEDGTRYFTISESRQSDGKYEHNRIMVFGESFEAFGVAFNRMSDFLASLTKGKVYDVKEVRCEYPQAYQPWTAEDDHKLSVKYRQGLTVPELSELFQRKPSAIQSRLRKIGVIASQ